MPEPRVLVVGAGISGFACARALTSEGIAVRVVDRGRRPGGRMGGRTLRGRKVDLGASYFTVPEGSAFAGVVEDWTERGLAREWTDTFAKATPSGLDGTTSGPMRYAAPGGLRALVTDLGSELELHGEHEVRRVESTSSGVKVDGRRYEAAALAMPDPQSRLLTSAAGPPYAEYEPTLAVVLAWRERQWAPDLHGAFVNDHDVVTWIADDGDRRGDDAPVLVAHSTPGFARRHLEDPDGAIAQVAAAVTGILGIGEPPTWTYAHRWTYAKPVEPREELFGLKDGIGFCGDSWGVPSKVESAWTSGDALGRELARTLDT